MQFVLYSHRTFLKVLAWSLLLFVPIYLYFLDFFVLDSLYIMVYISLCLLLIFYFFYKSFVTRLQLIANQIANIVARKPYERIPDMGLDEFGLISYFINDLVYNFENVASYLKSGQRMFTELSMAQHIQSNLLPKETVKIPNYEFLIKHRPADELGGDTFNFHVLDKQLFVYFADATGHGAPAALIMIMVQTLFLSNKNLAPKDLIILINSFLKNNTAATMFLSSVFGTFDEAGKFSYYGCGYEKILVYRQKEGVVETFDTKGVALGLLPDLTEKLHLSEISLNPLDVILFSSDGITELKNNANQMYGTDRLVDALSACGHLESMDEVWQAIKSDLEKFAEGALQLDDITVSVLRYRPDNKLSQNDFTSQF